MSEDTATTQEGNQSTSNEMQVVPPHPQPSKKRRTSTFNSSNSCSYGNSDQDNLSLQASMKMLPEAIHLKVYDYFLALRSYKEQCQLDCLNQMIKTLDKDANSECFDLDVISNKVTFGNDEVPRKIHFMMAALNFLLDDVRRSGYVKIEKRRFSFDRNDLEDVDLFRVLCATDDDIHIDILYDVGAFTKVATVNTRYMDNYDLDVRMDELLAKQVDALLCSQSTCLCLAEMDDGMEKTQKIHAYEWFDHNFAAANRERIVFQPDEFDEVHAALSAKCSDDRVSR